MSGRCALSAAALLAVVATAGCGVPTEKTPGTIPASDVPFGLLSTAPSVPASAPSTARSDRPRVYLLDVDSRLVPRGRILPAGPLSDELADLLDDLAGGPTTQERSQQFSTALPPGIRLTVTALDGRTATIDIVGGTDPSGRSSRLAAGQIVLTATSLPGIQAVRLRRNGEAVEAPLPGGQLTTDPLTTADYAGLTHAPPR